MLWFWSLVFLQIATCVVSEKIELAVRRKLPSYFQRAVNSLLDIWIFPSFLFLHGLNFLLKQISGMEDDEEECFKNAFSEFTDSVLYLVRWMIASILILVFFVVMRIPHIGSKITVWFDQKTFNTIKRDCKKLCTDYVQTCAQLERIQNAGGDIRDLQRARDTLADEIRACIEVGYAFVHESPEQTRQFNSFLFVQGLIKFPTSLERNDEVTGELGYPEVGVH